MNDKRPFFTSLIEAFRGFTDHRAFGALKSRNFRIFMFGQCFSLTGVWMQRMAMGWLVLHVTGRAQDMGLIELTNQAPIFIVAFFSGVLIDRFDTKRLLIVTQVLILIQALLLARLAFVEDVSQISFGQLLVLSLFLGIVNSIDAPTRQSCVPQTLDDRSRLPSALSLNSIAFNLARLIGPSMAGFVIVFVGEGGCFLLNALAFLFGIITVSQLRMPPRPAQVAVSPWKSLKEGLHYVAVNRVIRSMLVVFYLFNFFCIPYIILLPLYVKTVYVADARLLGFMLGAFGAGAILGVIHLAARVTLRGLLPHMSVCLSAFGVTYILFSQIRSVPIALLLLVVLGFACISTAIANNTLIQTIVDEKMRGRVMSFFVIGTMGFGPIGSLVVGRIADWGGVQAATVFCGCGAILTAVFLAVIRRSLLKEIEPTLATMD